MVRSVRIGVLLCLLLGFLAVGVGNADAGLCGKTIVKNITLHSDLYCKRAGLIVGADNVVVNLHHFTIFGRARAGFDGINVDGFDNVTIKNGTVSHFSNGIVFDGATNGFITHVSVLTGGVIGITLKSGANGNQLTSDLIKAFDGHGVQIFASANNTLVGVRAKKNSGIGIRIIGTGANGTTLTNDEGRHNEGGGIEVGFGTTGTVISGAITTTNTGTGISIGTTDTASTVANSTSNNNQSWGIIADNTSQDAGGNSATGNNFTDDPNQQCINVVCS